MMKRLPEPDIKHAERLNLYDLQIIREDYPSDWLLSELLFNIITLCHDAYGRTSAQMLLDSVLTLRDHKTEIETFFNVAYLTAYEKNETVLAQYMATVSKEVRAAWDNMSTWDDVQAFKKTLDDDMPRYQMFVGVGQFLRGEYSSLPKDLRTMTDLAFYGFIFTAVNGPDFAALCKNKGIDAAAMTFEQKLNEELDHEALHHRLMVQLGHA